MTDVSDSALFQDFLLPASVNGTVVYEIICTESGLPIDFRLVSLNEQAAIDFTKPAAFLQNQLVSALFSSTDSNYLIRQFALVVESGRAVRFEMPLAGDTAQPVEMLATRLNANCVGVSHSRKTAVDGQQQQPIKLAETFTGVLKTMRSGLNVLEIIRDETGNLADFRYQYVSDQVLLDTGLSREQLIGNRMLTLFPSVKESRFWTAYQELLATGESQEFEANYVYNGYNNHLLCQVTLLDQNRAISFYQIINDLKQIQIAFQEQSELLRSIIDNVQVGIGFMTAVRDESGKITDFLWVMTNAKNAHITGFPVETMLGANMTKLLPGTVESGFLASCAEVVHSGKPFQYEMRYNYDNLNGWYDIRIVKQGDGVLFSSADITKRKQAELDLEQQNRILQRANRDLQLSNENLQQFAYVASHDLQEPLRKIQAFGDILTDRFGPVLNTEGIDMLNRMQVAAKRMSLLIRDLLAYSRVSTQQEPHKMLSLNRVLSEVIDTLYIAIQESGADVTVAQLPNLMGDSGQLGQLFQNLLSNAIKFHQPNTVPLIRVTSQLRTLDQIPADVIPKLTGSGSFAEITVRDNGIGFNVQYADRIFQVFQRLHGRHQFAGSGIGLSICRRVAENHGGTIIASSEPGQGATFQVYLPV